MNPLTLAERFGTPAYVYDLAAVRVAHRDLRRALPTGASLYYSLKANPHPHLVAQLSQVGCHAEVSSCGEIDAALAGGMSPVSVLVTGPGKTEETIDYALERGVTRFSVDSPGDLYCVGDRSGHHSMRVDCLLRVNADEPVAGMGLAMTGVASQFGADASWILDEPGLFRESRGARVTGLHLYMGTNFEEEDRLLEQFEVAVQLAGEIGSVIGDISEADLGGGFGASYARHGDRPRFPGLARRLEAALDTTLPGWRQDAPRLSFESGRYLVADCGTLVSRIVDVKRSKGEVFVVLDTGVNHLGGMSGLRRVPKVSPDVQAPEEPADGDPVEAVVVGPLCTPLDTLGRGVPLAEPKRGELVSIPNVGAYGVTASLLTFLSHRPPIEIVCDGEDLVSVSRLHVGRELSREPHLIT